MDTRTAQSMVTPLQNVFWGSLICFLDLNINGFDVINDVLGILLICLGISRLSKLPVHGRYTNTMQTINTIAVICAIHTFLAQFAVEIPYTLQVASVFIRFVYIYAMYQFGMCMYWLSYERCLLDTVANWEKTIRWFKQFYIVPAIILYSITLLVTLSTGQQRVGMNGSIWLLILLLFVFMFIALLQYLVTLWRMIREADTPIRYA